MQDKELCFRYTGLKVRNIQKKVSPVDMRIRLFYCGSRAINLLADLTNYLMLEMGQPMHAFDCAKVDQIEVKRFDKPFQFTTLDGQERTVDENTLMICSKGEPVAIAGIMGGLDSEIEDDTDSLLLESANFDAVSVRKSSTRLGLRTDASMRYEKTLDPEITPRRHRPVYEAAAGHRSRGPGDFPADRCVLQAVSHCVPDLRQGLCGPVHGH